MIKRVILNCYKVQKLLSSQRLDLHCPPISPPSAISEGKSEASVSWCLTNCSCNCQRKLVYVGVTDNIMYTLQRLQPSLLQPQSPPPHSQVTVLGEKFVTSNQAIYNLTVSVEGLMPEDLETGDT